MIKRTSGLLLLSLFTILALSAAAHPVTAMLDVDPEFRLPGLYRFWRINLKNTGATAAVVPNRMAIQVLPAAGTPSVVIRSFDVPASNFDGRPRIEPLTLQPGESRELTDSPLLDELLRAATQSLPPGSYRVQLIIDEALDPAAIPGSGRLADLVQIVDPIASNSVLYGVEVPSGADLKVWELLRNLPPARWQELAERIWREYPDSEYAAEYVPYANTRDHAKAIATYEEALRKKPHPDIAQEHRLILAQHEIDKGFIALESSPEPDAAAAAFSRARTYLEEVIRNGRVPHHIEAANRKLPHALTREAVIRTQNALRGIIESRLFTFVQCADKLPDGSYKVTFGYFVDGDKTYSYATGSPENKFTPPPFDRGQIATFELGNHPSAFRVVTSDPELTWHIGKQNVVVKPRDLAPCPPPVPEQEPQSANGHGGA